VDVCFYCNAVSRGLEREREREREGEGGQKHNSGPNRYKTFDCYHVALKCLIVVLSLNRLSAFDLTSISRMNVEEAFAFRWSVIAAPLRHISHISYLSNLYMRFIWHKHALDVLCQSI